MTPSADVGVWVVDRISTTELEGIREIELASLRVDGKAHLDDQVRLDLEFGVPSTRRHLLARGGIPQEVLGYAHLDLGSAAASAHLVVHPDHRRAGIASKLFLALVAESASSRLGIWAHGDVPAARGFAGRLGLVRIRELWQMRRTAGMAMDAATYPADVSVRTFEPERDDKAWVELNAAAFADHPEQSRVSLDDLRQRMRQAWFDPAGFFLAERSGELVGFHWTKVHPATAIDATMGEVHALGVHPDAQGVGLGKALTLTGLHHLFGLGVGQVMLYVEADNLPAIGLYQRLGFGLHTTDVVYSQP
ncbi:MAG: mycothiol synthase [Nocardioidaceae bacterium]|nr:mycothiol synthase [Nocardioidaceae bacterium]